MLTRLKNLEFTIPTVRAAMRNLFFPDAQWTTVRWGPLRGMKIENRADVTLHLMIGAWELRNFAVLSRVFTAVNASAWQGIVLDIGSNLGAYGYWLQRVLPNATVYAFEASPDTFARLSQSLAAANCARVQATNAAIIDSDRTVEFHLAPDHHSHSVIPSFAHIQVSPTERASVRVQGIALDTFLAPSPHPVHFIKIDIEGGAIYALPGMANTIARHRPLLLIESHTPDEDRAISHMLLANNYDAYRLNTNQWVTHKDADHTNPDGVWGTMLCMPAETTPQLTKVLS